MRGLRDAHGTGKPHASGLRRSPGPVFAALREAPTRGPCLVPPVMTAQHCTPLSDDFGPGTMTLTSARGDEVWITYSGSAPFPGEGVTVYLGSLVFKIVGGTGRYADAVGGGSMIIEIVFQGFEDPTWPAWWTWNGTIGY
jgi:hypothetical protein